MCPQQSSTVFKTCPLIKEALFNPLQYMWTEEVVPQSLVTVRFKMFFKHKGSSNDPARYRCITLLNHFYKVLSYRVLRRLLEPSKDFLQDWQAGFRESRGCRDNTMTFRVLCEKVMSIGQSLAAVFIDYKTAFDSLSHKFIDTSLGKAGVSPKVRSWSDPSSGLSTRPHRLSRQLLGQMTNRSKATPSASTGASSKET